MICCGLPNLPFNNCTAELQFDSDKVSPCIALASVPSNNECRYLNLSTFEISRFRLTAKSNDSQNPVHLVTSPLNLGRTNLGKRVQVLPGRASLTSGLRGCEELLLPPDELSSMRHLHSMILAVVASDSSTSRSISSNSHNEEISLSSLLKNTIYSLTACRLPSDGMTL